jgi:hypothetical protein
MESLKIFVLNQFGPLDGEYNVFVDVPSVMGFFRRTGTKPHRFHVLATKGKRVLFIDKIDPATLERTLNTFQTQN